MTRDVAVLPSDTVELRDLALINDSGDLDSMPVVRIRSQEGILEDTSSGDKTQGRRRKFLKLCISFFLFGLVNDVLYVIILSAALDLVPPSTPKGIVAFSNIFPAVMSKLGWSYLLRGKVRYTRRIVGCTLSSFIGTLRDCWDLSRFFFFWLGGTNVFATVDHHSLSMGGHSVGYFASSSGAAGLVGAFLWWKVRGLVRLGIGISSMLPFFFPLVYFLLLPRPAAFVDSPSPGSYTPLPKDDPDISTAEVTEGDTLLGQPSKVPVFLTARDKWRLVKPMIYKYMLPLFLVYTFEYTINQGVAPTLLYPVPLPERNGLLSKIIHSIRDYYPLWQLVHQSTVFISRSSISLGVPPLPEKFLPLPAIAQFLILLTLVYESAVGIFAEDHPASSIVFVFLLISLEGTCGGLAYVNVFYRINQERPEPTTVSDMERSRQEFEFEIGSLGFSDASGILLAALLAIPTEVQLCRAQVARMKMFCRGL